ELICSLVLVSSQGSYPLLCLLPFPTRRSSDLRDEYGENRRKTGRIMPYGTPCWCRPATRKAHGGRTDLHLRNRPSPIQGAAGKDRHLPGPAFQGPERRAARSSA